MELWDNYGVDNDIIVSFNFHHIIILADDHTMKSFTNNFPHANIYEMLAPDLLHQVIKGSFKDHLVEWIGEYLKTVYGESQGNLIKDDIDHHIAATPCLLAFDISHMDNASNNGLEMIQRH